MKCYKTKVFSCLKCGEEGVDDVQILWTCIKIQEFWGKVNDRIEQYNLFKFPSQFEPCILGVIDKMDTPQHREIASKLLFRV